MGDLADVPRDYFFVMKEPDQKQFWGFDIRSLVSQYEKTGVLENPYTKTDASPVVLATFRARVEQLRRWKRALHYEEVSGLSAEQSWNLRVLDMCLRLDLLGYRISTQWFSELSLDAQKRLYSILYLEWIEGYNITPEVQNLVVPDGNKPQSRLFKWHPNKILRSPDLDSVRRTNLNVIERMISSAVAQSDQTLGAMYVVRGLALVNPLCRRAYPWLLG